MVEMQAAYRLFLKRYGRMMRGAEKLMDSEAQKVAFRGAVVTAFSAGFRAPRTAPPKVKFTAWRGRNDPQ